PLDLANLRMETATAANIGYYAQIVADAAGKRRLEMFAAKAGQLARSDDKFSDLMQVIRQEWETVNTHSVGGIEARTLRELLDGPDDYDWIIPNLLERQDRVVIT